MDYKQLVLEVKAYAPFEVACHVEDAIDALTTERDALLKQLRGKCSACKHYSAFHSLGPCRNCVHNCVREEPSADNWEWKGV